MATGRVNVGGGAGLNIFTQMSEPSTKEGIWLKTDKKFKKILSPESLIAGVEWVDRDLGEFANVPYAAEMHITERVGNKVFVMGGQLYPQTQNWCYDLDLNVWTQKANISTATYNMASTTHGTNIYLLGGTGNADRVLNVYDTINNTWTTKTTIPNTSNKNQAAVTVGDYIYLIGTGVNYARMQIYDIVNNTWTTKGNAPETYWTNMKAVVHDNNIYVFGGSSASSYLDKVYKYEIDTDTWTLVTNMPYSVSMHDVVIAEGKAYILGGYNGTTNLTNVYEYNFNSNSFIPLENMPYGVRHHGVIYYNNRIHVFGGVDYPTYHQVLNLEPSSFPEGTFIILRSNENTGAYLTEIVSPSQRIEGINTRLLSGFNNAWLFIDGLLQEYPAYYGNGTQWIKFKN